MLIAMLFARIVVFLQAVYTIYIYGDKYFDRTSGELCHGIWHFDGSVLDSEVHACAFYIHGAAYSLALSWSDGGSPFLGLLLCPAIPQPLLPRWKGGLHAGVAVLSADVCLRRLVGVGGSLCLLPLCGRRHYDDYLHRDVG